ncbi:MAG: response regulator transcription factor [Anaerolineae bacterium]|nr:response regulator transcription factor [Anaerolineae bacterium]
MSKIRVLLAEDHTIVRKGIRSLLDDEPDMEVVGEASDGHETVEKTEKLMPDVVLMDITMPHLNGLEATRQIKKLLPDVKILGLTMYTNEEYILQLLQAGASGYVVKQSAPSDLISAIRAVYRGDSFLSPEISKVIIDEYLKQAGQASQETSYDKLTDREREVLQLITEGLSNRDIADKLHISVKTVGVHRTNLMEKLNIHNTIDLVKYAIRKGIIRLD